MKRNNHSDGADPLVRCTSWREVWAIVPKEKYVGGTFEIRITGPAITMAKLATGHEDYRKTLEHTSYYRTSIKAIDASGKPSRSSLTLAKSRSFDKKSKRWIECGLEDQRWLFKMLNNIPSGGMSGIGVDMAQKIIFAVSIDPMSYNVELFAKGERVPSGPRLPRPLAESNRLIMAAIKKMAKKR